MSAAGRRSALEANLRHVITSNGQCTAKGKCASCEAGVTDVLFAADVYATAFAAERVDGMTADQWRGRLKLAEVMAEADRKTS